MNKQAFLNELARLTAALPEKERARLLDYYAELIDDSVEEGIPEAEAVAALGDPAALARELASAGERTGAADKPSSQSVPALNGLRVRVASADVTILRDAPSDGAAAQLRFSDPERFAWRMDGDVMEITERGPEGGKFSLNRVLQTLSSPDLRVTIALAGDLPGALEFTSAGGDLWIEGVGLGSARLNSSSGDIRLKTLTSGARVEITGRSGDVRSEDVRAAELKVRTVSGDITASGLTVHGTLCLDTTSGDIELRGLTGGVMTVATRSGDIEIDRGTAGSTLIQTASGDVRLDELETNSTLRAETASGDIALRRCIALLTWLKAVSGDVTVRLEPLPCGYDISANTTSGDLRIEDTPPARPGEAQPKLVIQTVSGDIEARPAVG